MLTLYYNTIRRRRAWQRPCDNPNAHKQRRRPNKRNANGKTLAARENMEKYFITITNGNGETIRTATAAAAFAFDANGKATNDIYTKAAALVNETPTAAAFRVYPCRDSLLVLRCMKTAASVAANKGGKAASVEHNEKGTPTAAKAAAKASKATAAARLNATQAAIDSDLRRISAATLAALCSTATAAAFDVDLFIYEHIATANAHTQDFFSVGMLAAIENANATPTEKTAAIYKAANAWIYANKAAAARDVSTEWIIDGGGDLVAFGTAAASILKGGERWQPTAAANMDIETAAALGETLAAAFATLTPTERKITLYIVNGYSQRQAAAKMGYNNASTINRKIAMIRKAFSDYIETNAAEFMSLVRNAETKAAAKAAKANGGENRERRNARQKEYMRQRRAKAKAAKA